MKRLIGLMLLFVSSHVVSQPLTVPGKPGEEKLMQDIFVEIVKRSNRFDSVRHLYGSEGDPNTDKMLEDLRGGALDIVYVATNKANEDSMSAIYFPIYRGLLGMRLGIVRSDNRHILANVNTLSDLRRLKACQGKAWPDTEILEYNNIKVAKSLNYPNMFPMLEGGRCDYFPRGAHEPFVEVRDHRELNLMVDENIIVRYKMPFYFFTNKRDPELAKHFEDILIEMFEDGTYERLFFRDPQVRASLELGNLRQRTIIDLINPDESAGTRNIPEKFWFNPLLETSQ